MTRSRLLLLILGPPLLIAAARALAMPPEGPLPDPSTLRASGMPREKILAPVSDARNAAECARTAREIAILLGPDCEVIVRPPFVIAGDQTAAILEQYHEQTIAPVAAALRGSFFDRLPDRPITIVLLSNQKLYRHHARKLDGYDVAAYYGYYERTEYRLVVNLSTGEGTLAHELTHSLAHCDFPEMPEWFDEGLAALHEQSEFSEDGLQLRGLANWRLQSLLEARGKGRLPSLKSLFNPRTFRGEGEGLNYALVRYLCLYLQQRELLGGYYRTLRAAVQEDPQGLQTLLRVLEKNSIEELDADFSAWLQSLRPPAKGERSPRSASSANRGRGP